MAKIYELKNKSYREEEKGLVDYLVPLHTSGKVAVKYERGKRVYKNPFNGEELSPEEVFNLLDDNIKKPKSFLDAFERNLVMRGL